MNASPDPWLREMPKTGEPRQNVSGAWVVSVPEGG